MKKLVLLPLIAALAVAAVGSGGASRQSPAAAGSALITCGKVRTIGMSTILTGDAASLGLQQLRWVQFFVARYNRTHKNKLRLIPGDTQLNTAQALAVAHQFASNSKILALVGPAGSQEVQDTVAVYKSGGLPVVTGSATRVALSRGKPG